MFDESYLIQHLKDNTPYKDIDFSEYATIDDPGKILTTPIIRVGHLGISLMFPEQFNFQTYNNMENREILTTEIQIVCARSSLATVRTTIRNAYITCTPFPDDGDYGTVSFLKAAVINAVNTNIWWREVVGIGMPRYS